MVSFGGLSLTGCYAWSGFSLPLMGRRVSGAPFFRVSGVLEQFPVVPAVAFQLKVVNGLPPAVRENLPDELHDLGVPAGRRRIQDVLVVADGIDDDADVIEGYRAPRKARASPFQPQIVRCLMAGNDPVPDVLDLELVTGLESPLRLIAHAWFPQTSHLRRQPEHWQVPGSWFAASQRANISR